MCRLFADSLFYFAEAVNRRRPDDTSTAVCTLCHSFFQYSFDVFFAERDFVVSQRRMHQEHQAGVAQFDGVFQPFFRSPRRVVEGLFQINFVSKTK